MKYAVSLGREAAQRNFCWNLRSGIDAAGYLVHTHGSSARIHRGFQKLQFLRQGFLDVRHQGLVVGRDLAGVALQDAAVTIDQVFVKIPFR